MFSTSGNQPGIFNLRLPRVFQHPTSSRVLNRWCVRGGKLSLKLLLALLLLVVIGLHQDLWNWTNKTLVFGFVPIGLAYHAFYSILAACTMALFVHFLWPKELEEEDAVTTPEDKQGYPVK
jgi:hypothetical protein